MRTGASGRRFGRVAENLVWIKNQRLKFGRLVDKNLRGVWLKFGGFMNEILKFYLAKRLARNFNSVAGAWLRICGCWFGRFGALN